MEQALFSWQFSDNHRVYLGRFYVPIGSINSREAAFSQYGTLRNPVEINIIPTNWVETGIGFEGKISKSWRYTASGHSGLATGDAGLVRDGRNASSFAVTPPQAVTLRAQYEPSDNFIWSTTAQFQVDVTGFVGDGNSSSGLIQTHIIYTSNQWTTKAFWAYWDIDGINFELSGREKQNGWYIESSYRKSEKLGFFARINEWDNQQDNRIASRILQIDAGLNWWVKPELILKADISHAANSADFNRFNLVFTWQYDAN